IRSESREFVHRYRERPDSFKPLQMDRLRYLVQANIDIDEAVDGWKEYHPKHASFEDTSGENDEYSNTVSILTKWLNQRMVNAEPHQDLSGADLVPCDIMSIERTFMSSDRQYSAFADEYDLWNAFNERQMYSHFTTNRDNPTRICISDVMSMEY